MKLFSTSENNNLKQSEIARDSARIEQVRVALLDAQQRLDETEAKFDLALAKQQTYLAEEEQKYLIKLEALRSEVKLLEERQKVAYFPIAPVERKAYNNLEKSKEVLLEAQNQKLKNEYIEEALTNKLDSLSERDRLMDIREDKVKAMEIAGLDQKARIQNLSEKLAEEWNKFYVTSADHNTNIKEREKLVELHDKDLSSREDVILEREEQIKKDFKKIQSDKETIKTAFEELNSKLKKMTINQFGTRITNTATGTTSATASITGVAGVTYFVTDISGSSDLTGATIQVKDGSTVIWQDRVSNSSGYVVNFGTPLACTIGNTLSVVVTGTSASNANVVGFSITP